MSSLHPHQNRTRRFSFEPSFSTHFPYLAQQLHPAGRQAKTSRTGPGTPAFSFPRLATRGPLPERPAFLPPIHHWRRFCIWLRLSRWVSPSVTSRNSRFLPPLLTQLFGSTPLSITKFRPFWGDPRSGELSCTRDCPARQPPGSFLSSSPAEVRHTEPRPYGKFHDARTTSALFSTL